MGGDENDGDEHERTRLLAACDDCGAVYAAVEVSDGAILPIGNRDGCRCGGTEFSSLNQSLESGETDTNGTASTDE